MQKLTADGIESPELIDCSTQLLKCLDWYFTGTNFIAIAKRESAAKDLAPRLNAVKPYQISLWFPEHFLDFLSLLMSLKEFSDILASYK